MSDERQEATRPSPEALLETAQQEGRGRLKVFLGAAPGVGKTFEMLQRAKARRLEGDDVVIGVVETHGRMETEILTRGLETIPKKRIPYRGQVLLEMDLDAVLQRHPKLVLVDELAHSNAPGSRHPKRYVDVEELLEAGIDVYTTLNIQHIESLNDVVAKITRIRVREIVPDSVLDRADEVELVDTTPDDLLQRLREGKVYVPETAARAVRHYFMPGNLAALRELALRRTAQRVDEQVLSYMRSHAIKGPWESSERVLVCVNERASSLALVRFTRRLADRLKGSWTAIYIETSHTSHLTETERDRIAEALRMTERLGGQTVTLPAANAAEAIIDYARANNFTHVVLSSYPKYRLWELVRGSFLNAVIRRAGDINLHIVPSPEAPSNRADWHLLPRKPGFGDRYAYLGSTTAVIAALVIGEILSLFGITNVALVFLTAVLASAVRYGLLPALFTCVLSSLAYNFFFLPPLYTFTVADPENVIALFFFAVVAVITSNLTARIRAQAVAAQERAQVTESLYQFSRKLAAIADVDDLLWAAAYQISSMLKVHVVLLLPDEDSLVIRCGYPPEDSLTEMDLAAAKWAWTHGTAAGRGADTLTGAKRLFLPLRTGRDVVGIVGLDSDRGGPLLTPDQRRLLDALADQIAVAVERIFLADEFDRARIASEAERLQAALLTSLSHDLRTPLASILGSAMTLRNYGENLNAADREEMLATITDESQRLNRFIANLLDMTRLESGVLRPRLDDVDLTDVIGSALSRARTVLTENKVETQIEDNLPFAKADAVLLEQALFNLLDNAAKHAGPGALVQVKAVAGAEQVHLIVMDNGPGIPEASLEKIFDKFHRLEASDSKRAGTGLGLAISRGFVEAIGGTVTASNRKDQPGAVFTVSLPQSHHRVADEGSLS